MPRGRRKTQRFTDILSSPEAQIRRGHAQAEMSRGNTSTRLHRAVRLQEGRESARNLIEGTIRKNKREQRRAKFNDNIERLARGSEGGD